MQLSYPDPVTTRRSILSSENFSWIKFWRLEMLIVKILICITLSLSAELQFFNCMKAKYKNAWLKKKKKKLSLAYKYERYLNEGKIITDSFINLIHFFLTFPCPLAPSSTEWVAQCKHQQQSTEHFRQSLYPMNSKLKLICNEKKKKEIWCQRQKNICN